MKKFFAILLAAVLALTCVSCGSSGAKLRFVTGSESGTYYGFGSVLAQHATNNAGISVTGVVGAGSKSNINELEDGNAELAFCQSDVMAYAYQGTNLFDAPVTCFSTVAALYTEQVQIVTIDESIKTVADLEGRRVSVGAAGSGVYFNAVDILSAYGIGDLDADGKFTKIDATYQSFGDSADALKDGKIDAAFIVAGAPTTAVTDLATTKPVHLVSLDDAHIDALLQESPYYTKVTIAKDVYNLDADVTTVAVGAVVLARNDVSEDAIYAFTKDIFDNYQNLTANHAKYAELSLEYASSITSVPYHPGAAKYFAEKGITVPAATK